MFILVKSMKNSAKMEWELEFLKNKYFKDNIHKMSKFKATNEHWMELLKESLLTD